MCLGFFFCNSRICLLHFLKYSWDIWKSRHILKVHRAVIICQIRIWLLFSSSFSIPKCLSPKISADFYMTLLCIAVTFIIQLKKILCFTLGYYLYWIIKMKKKHAVGQFSVYLSLKLKKVLNVYSMILRDFLILQS